MKTLFQRSFVKVGAPIVPIIAVGLLAAVSVGASQPIQPTQSSARADTNSQNPVNDFFSMSSTGGDISLQVPGTINAASDQSTNPAGTSGSDQTAPDTSVGSTTGSVSITINTNQSYSSGDDGSGTGNSTPSTNSSSHSTSNVSVNSHTSNDGKTTGNSSSLVIQNGKVVQNTHHNF